MSLEWRVESLETVGELRVSSFKFQVSSFLLQRKAAIKRENNDARICFSEREQTRPKVKAEGLYSLHPFGV